MFEIEGEYAMAKVFAKDLEKGTITQIGNLCGQEFAADAKIRIMPDAHAGAGCVIGTTMTIKDKIVPNLVGVDISCGVEAVRIDADEIDFAVLDAAIREHVPSGFAIRNRIHEFAADVPFEALSCRQIVSCSKWPRAIGTLGGGNHFIEIDRDDAAGYWLVIHSGSRNPGLQVAQHHQKIAHLAHPDAGELAWLEGDAFEDYVHDMKIMQKFADANRKAMCAVIMAVMGWQEKDRFTTTHNYLDTDSMILRKGAVSARQGERFILPMNMRDGSVVCVGKGNDDWNQSAPHGAGRILSRGQARRSLSLEEMKEEMKDVWTASLCDETLDEAPGAYKPMHDILDAIEATAEIAWAMKPVYNFKAIEGGRGIKRRRASMECR